MGCCWCPRSRRPVPPTAGSMAPTRAARRALPANGEAPPAPAQRREPGAPRALPARPEPGAPPAPARRQEPGARRGPPARSDAAAPGAPAARPAPPARPAPAASRRRRPCRAGGRRGRRHRHRRPPAPVDAAGAGSIGPAAGVARAAAGAGGTVGSTDGSPLMRARMSPPTAERRRATGPAPPARDADRLGGRRFHRLGVRQRSVPRMGWGQMFQDFFAPPARPSRQGCRGAARRASRRGGLDAGANALRAGTSSSSVRSQRRSRTTRCATPIRSRPTSSTCRSTSTQQGQGATPLLLTSINRNNWSNGVLQDTPATIRWRCGSSPGARDRARGCHPVDQDLLQRIGQAATTKLFMDLAAGQFPNYPDGNTDNTHLRKAARIIGQMILADLYRQGLPPGRLPRPSCSRRSCRHPGGRAQGVSARSSRWRRTHRRCRRCRPPSPAPLCCRLMSGRSLRSADIVHRPRRPRMAAQGPIRGRLRAGQSLQV